MTPSIPKLFPCSGRYASHDVLSRREMLRKSAGGLGGIALSWLLGQAAAKAAGTTRPALNLLPKQPHFPVRARNVIFLYMGGGPSHIDLFEPKPLLAKYDGQTVPFSVEQRDVHSTAKVMASPFKFPTRLHPRVPELLELGPPVDFGTGGADAVIVQPDGLGSENDAQALRGMIRLIQQKMPHAPIVTTAALTAEQRRRHLIVLGTAKDNLDLAGTNFLDGIGAGGYRLRAIINPAEGSKRVLLALGADLRGAWAVAGVLAYSIHPQAARLGELREPWPVRMGDGTYWVPFEAEHTGAVAASAKQELAAADAPPRPRVPFGVRIWGSPMPPIDTYRRIVTALRGLGANTVVVQSGGWPDLPDCGPLFRDAVEAGWREGLHTILYAGNEMDAHLPAPLTDGHRALVAATKDHPGLLGWHLYNQLRGELTPEQRALVEQQMRWLRSVSGKPIANEIVWGHNVAEMPAVKAQLITDLKSWGMNAVAHDYAPVGGWTLKPDMSLWETRLSQFRRFDVAPEAVLQAHVPFLDPRVPKDVELRNQFWWAMAGGARAFFIECAYNFTHFSNRGLLTWDLREQPDSRCDEVRRLAETVRRLEPMIADGQPVAGKLWTALGAKVTETHGGAVALRLKRTPDGTLWLVLINKSLDRASRATVTLAVDAPHFTTQEITPGTGPREFSPERRLVAEIPPGGGACFRLVAAPTSP